MAAPYSYAPGVSEMATEEQNPRDRLSIYDPITGAYVNVDPGASSMATMTYQILVELRVMNQTMQRILQATVPTQTDDVDNIRADQSVAEPLFAQAR